MELVKSSIKEYLFNFVTKEQDNITFHSCKGHWPDVEVDECTFGKISVDDESTSWHNYVGLVQRGRPSSLSTYSTSWRCHYKKGPGPGPIRLRDWQPIGRKFLSHKGVVLHTDSARAYKWKMPLVAHTRVTPLALKSPMTQPLQTSRNEFSNYHEWSMGILGPFFF